MRIFGLIGKSIDHSWSKAYFLQKFMSEGIIDCLYENFQLDGLGNLRNLIQSNEDLRGINITVPFKLEVIPYLDGLDPLAESVRAVNCIKIIRKKSSINLKGYNTDMIAFRETIKPLLKKEYRNALVLGTGGASRAVCQALKELNIEHTLVSRTQKAAVLTYPEISKKVIENHQVIINTTPVGMNPDEGKCLPIPYQALTADHLLYDLIYNPEETIFLKKSRDAGAQIKNGLEMLHLQAELSWEIWNNQVSSF